MRARDLKIYDFFNNVKINLVNIFLAKKQYLLIISWKSNIHKEKTQKRSHAPIPK